MNHKSSLDSAFSTISILPVEGRTSNVERWRISNSGANKYLLPQIGAQNEANVAKSVDRFLWKKPPLCSQARWRRPRWGLGPGRTRPRKARGPLRHDARQFGAVGDFERIFLQNQKKKQHPSSFANGNISGPATVEQRPVSWPRSRRLRSSSIQK